MFCRCRNVWKVWSLFFNPTRRLEEAVRGIESINADYAGHSAAARKLVEERLAAPNVMQSILERAGVL